MINVQNTFPIISVVMPMYNAALFLKACMDSVLSQSFKNFEFIIVDDGSIDDSVDIVKSYHDFRIRLIKKNHDFVGSCNALLHEARGKYLVRMDADDVMTPNRLKIQFEYMELHSDVDVMSGSMEHINGDGGGYVVDEPFACTVEGMLKDNLIANSTTIFRRDFIIRNKIQYNPSYVYAEDYGFWMSMLLSGAKIMIEPQVFVVYRHSKYQTTRVHYKEMLEATSLVKENVRAIVSKRQNKDYVNPLIVTTDNKLTIIIPFLNEGEEVGKTVESIRHTVGEKVDIIVINDCSTDGYHYFEDLQPFNVYYFVNEKRLGVAASRDMGIHLSKTPYFLLLDGHMRFYDSNWSDYIVGLLHVNDRRLLCTQGRYLEKVDGVVRDIESRTYQSFGAYMPLIKGHTLTEIIWKGNEYDAANELEQIPVVLGAGYAASKRYWKYLHGLEGLRYYGNDEAYISLKVWMEGGECVLLKNVITGHIYRKKSPYKRYSADELFNELLISYLLFPQSLRCVEFATLSLNNRDLYMIALKKFQAESERWKHLKKYYQGIFTRSFRDFAKIQKILCSQKIEEKNVPIEAIARFISEHHCVDVGLFDGAMGQLLWLCIYEGTIEDQSYRQHVQSLWKQIVDALKQKKMPYNFGYGMAGIGWGLIYLKENGFIEDGILDEIQTIDQQLCCYAFQNDNDLSIATGIGGLFAYIMARIRYGINYAPAKWIIDRKGPLMEMAQKIIDESNEQDAITYAMRYICFVEEGYDEKDYPLNLGEWISIRNFIPKNPKRWTAVLNDTTLTTSILYLTIKYQEKQNGKI